MWIGFKLKCIIFSKNDVYNDNLYNLKLNTKLNITLGIYAPKKNIF